jgi:hypothetical protein
MEPVTYPSHGEAFIATRVPPAWKADLLRVAQRNERSIASELRLIIRRHLEAERPEGLAVG